MKALLAATVLLCGGCDFYYYKVPSPDQLWHIIPWFDHMITARYVRPYETAAVPRYTPAGTVPVSSEGAAIRLEIGPLASPALPWHTAQKFW